MHPTNKKTAIYSLFISIIAIPVIAYASFDNFLFGLFPLIAFALIYVTKLEVLYSYLITISLASIMYLPFFTAKSIITAHTYWQPAHYVFFTVISFIIARKLYPFINNTLTEIIKLAKKEKKHYALVLQHPNVVCSKHHTESTLKKPYGYNNLNCRLNENCINKGHLQVAKHIIGFYGISKREDKENYYIKLATENANEIKDADYDILEFHENNQIDNYDAKINKIITYLYNDIKRYKSLNKISIHIYGRPDISDNTKRLLSSRFSEVKYIN